MHEKPSARCCTRGIWRGIRVIFQRERKEYVPVDVFLGGDGLRDCADAVGVDVGTEGQLDENAAYLAVGVELLDEGDNLVDRG